MAYTKDPPTHGRKPPCYCPDGGLGDISGDGRISTVDVAMMRQASVGDITLSQKEASRSDLDGDGIPADSTDIATLHAYVNGDIDTFAVCGKMGYPTTPPTHGKAPPCYGPDGGMGDISGDGRISSIDEMMMHQAASGDLVLSQKEASRSDLDGDGTPADSTDVAAMVQFGVGDITTFPVCGMMGGIDPITTPDMRSLEPGSYNIVISKSGYDTVFANITVSTAGTVSCNDVTGVAGCGSDYPRVAASGNDVKVHMAAAGTAPSGYTEWVASKGGASGLRSNLSSIGDIIDGYLSSAGSAGYLGFTVSLANIGTTIDYYLG